mmetsp:Transcript_20711/g.37629  ORF Transcript_20711/g.37629 Transcript_20711/m.37629 type:complete len:389 (-) Transcript_20711:204-1370(-)
MPETQADCPIFLRKTYAMIDSCDPSIACWSEDGKTFIVKNTSIFEKQTIPTFFKHSKFSSFVRQLNFYGFRKIKYSDTLVIDKKLEAETANYWRFKHDKFQRGKPELLSKIKRSNGQSTTTSSGKTEDANLKSEVTTLKKRIEAMTKNIDDLTSLVEQVTLNQDIPVKEEVGNKRKKVELENFDNVRPDEALSAGMVDLEEDLEILAEAPLSAVPPPAPPRRQGSELSQLSDDDFVDHLFTAFGDDEGGASLGELSPMEIEPVRSADEKNNSPDPVLMKSLSDALSLLPREVQEMIVNRLIASITGTASLDKDIGSAVTSLSDTKKEAATPSQVPPSPVLGAKPEPEIPISLAAATLAAFLSHYGTTVKDKAVQKSLQKAAVPIPIHA